MAETHSFDIVCKVEMHEVNNAIDQAQKQLAVRYDFKGSKSSITLNKDNSITLVADDDYKMGSLTEILKEKLAKRDIPLKALSFGKAESALGVPYVRLLHFNRVSLWKRLRKSSNLSRG